MRDVCWLGPVIGAVLVSAGAVGSEPGFEWVQDLRAFDASDDVSMLVGDGPDTFVTPTGPLWRRAFFGVRSLPDPGAALQQWAATAVSPDGTVVAGRVATSADLAHEASLWFSPDAQPVRLGVLPRESTSVVNALTPGGALAVGTSGGDRPFVWTESTGMVELALGSRRTLPAIPTDVSASGGVIVGYSDSETVSPPIYPVYWDGSGVIRTLELLDPNDPVGFATGVSADGKVIAGTSRLNGELHTVLWRGGVIEDLGSPFPAGFSRTLGISADGTTIIGDGFETQGDWQTWVWSERLGMRLLEDIATTDLGEDLDGWRLGGVVAVSADGGCIVGLASKPGVSEARTFLLRPTSVGADVTTSGATLPGFPGFAVPDGVVNLDDLGAYLNAWLEGGL